MPLYTYTLDQAADWDAVVTRFARHDVYYLSGYVKAFQLHGDGQPLLFYYEGDGLRGIHVVMKRDIAAEAAFAPAIPRDTLFDFITPYGYGGWLLEGEGEKAPLLAAYEEWCRAHHIVSEFVRYHPLLHNTADTEDFYETVPLGHTVAMDLASPETVWANLTSKNRNMVRKAQKSGVTIHHGNDPERYKEFKEIYNRTMEADNARDYYYFGDPFYESIQKDLAANATLFWAEVEGLCIAASIMLFANGQMHYHLSGSRREWQHLAPTNLLLYEAALWGCRHGCKSLHLGGGVGSREDSLYKFKSAFNRGEPHRFVIGKKIYLTQEYAQLTEINGPATGDFFPAYRA